MTALNIEDEESVRLAKAVAALEGGSLTTVVTWALREKLDWEQAPQINEARMQYWLDSGGRVRAIADPERLAKARTEGLYDEERLP